MSMATFEHRTEPSIATVIDRARRSLFLGSLFRGVCRWLVAVGGVAIALMVLDNLLGLPTALRLTLSLGTAAFAAATGFAWIIRPLVDRRSPESVAFLIERRLGVHDNSLVGALQFERLGAMIAGDGVQRTFMHETERLGRRTLSAVDVKALIEPGQLLRWLALATLVFAGWAAYVSLAPSWSGTALKRFLLPLADVPPASSVQIIVRLPDGVVVPQGGDVPVEVEVVGPVSGRSYPELVWSEQGSVDVDDPKAVKAAMEPAADRAGTFVHRLRNVRRDLAFRVAAEGTHSPLWRVQVMPMPVIVSGSFTIVPPEYTGREPLTAAGPPQPLDGLVGSKVAMSVEIDRPVRTLAWRLGSDDIACANAGMVWRADAILGKVESYALVAKIDGLSTPITIARGRVVPRQDQPPQVRFVTDRFAYRLRLGDTLPYRVSAGDDQGLRSLDVLVRSAKGGEPRSARRWDYDPPGRTGEVVEAASLAITPDVFAEGQKYMLEAAGRDARPDAPPAVTKRPLLIEIIAAADGADADDPASKSFFEALDRAIAAQKQALEATRSFGANLPEVWLDPARKPRPPAEVGPLLDQYRKAVLGPQRSVLELILAAAGTPGADARAATRLRELAAGEAMAAGDAADALTLPTLGVTKGGEVVAKLEVAAGNIGVARFTPRKARWMTLVVPHTGGWQEAIDLRDITVQSVAEGLKNHGGWQEAAPMPRAFVVDMGAEIEVASVSIRNAGPPVRGMVVRLSSGDRPEITTGDRTETTIRRQVELLEPMQAALYAELLILRGRERESRDEQRSRAEDPAVASAPMADDVEKKMLADLAEWKKDFERNASRRKALTDRSFEDLSQEERDALMLVDVEKRQLTRRIQRLTEDLTDSLQMDLGDQQRREMRTKLVKGFSDVAELAALADKKAQKNELSWKLDSQAIAAANELSPDSTNPHTSGKAGPGKVEDEEDKKPPPDLRKLAAIAELQLPELTKKWDDMSDAVDRSASAPMADAGTDEVGSGILSLNSASGRPSDRTPEQRQRFSGKSVVGRTAQSDGQFVGDVAKQLPGDEVLAPDRNSATALEAGTVVDESSSEATSTGLGKLTNAKTEFGEGGKLPPEVLKRMQKAAGEATELRHMTNQLVMQLEVMNLSTVGLREAIREVEFAEGEARRGSRAGLRQAVDRSKDAFEKARAQLDKEIKAVVAARRRDETRRLEGRFDDRVPIPGGYDTWAAAYFRALAEREQDAAAVPEQPR